MKKRKYFYLCASIAFLCMKGCMTNSNEERITPSSVIEGKESIKIQESVFKETKETQEKEESKNREEREPTSNVITKTDGLCEQLEKVETDATFYNIFNRMLGNEIAMGAKRHSMFCLDETTGGVYFVNEGKDNFLYRMKDGEVALAVAMPMKQLYPYEGSVYFMVDDYGTYQLEGMKTGDIYCYTPSTGAVELVYAAGTVSKETFANAKDYKLLVEESGIYFCYSVIGEDSVIHTYAYSLPFGASEAIEDAKCTAKEGWGEYYFGGSARVEGIRFSMALVNRITGERTTIPVRGVTYCLIGDVVYYADHISMESYNLATGERISYDFTESMKTREYMESDQKIMDYFTVTEDAFWFSTRNRIYRVDLQTKEITCGSIPGKTKGTSYYVHELYTDGKEVYALTNPLAIGIQKGVVRLVFTDEKDIRGDSIIKFEYLTD